MKKVLRINKIHFQKDTVVINYSINNRQLKKNSIAWVSLQLKVIYGFIFRDFIARDFYCQRCFVIDKVCFAICNHLLCVYEYVHVYMSYMYVWKSENNLEELLFSFHHVDLRD